MLIEGVLMRYHMVEKAKGHHLIPEVVDSAESALKNIEGVYLRYNSLMQTQDDALDEYICSWLKANTNCDEWRIDFMDLTKTEYDELEPMAQKMYLHSLKK